MDAAEALADAALIAYAQATAAEARLYGMSVVLAYEDFYPDWQERYADPPVPETLPPL